jgi:hypothetical protein
VAHARPPDIARAATQTTLPGGFLSRRADRAPLEQRGRLSGLGAEFAGEARPVVLASQHLLADVGDQRTAEAEHGVGCHPGRDAGGIGVRLLGHEGGEGVGVPGADLLLAGEGARGSW